MEEEYREREKPKKWLIIVGAVVILLLVFWLSVRPALTRRYCSDKATKFSGITHYYNSDTRTDYDTEYQYCLHGKGL